MDSGFFVSEICITNSMKLRVTDYTSKNFPDSGIRFQVKHKGAKMISGGYSGFQVTGMIILMGA